MAAKMEDIKFAPAFATDEPKLLDGAEEDPEESTGESAPSGEVILNKNDRSLAELARWEESGRLIVDPEWQRGYVWDRKRASRLIESFLKDVPVPVIYLAQREDGKYDIIDGLQRLTSVFKYFRNGYDLYGLQLFENLNGKKFKELPEQLQNKLQDATIRTFELSSKTPKAMMFLIFERLNTGGVALNEMEIRNCIYSGKLMKLLTELSKNEDFITVVNTDTISKRMDDRALILRFLAFHERHYSKCKGGLKRFLNEFSSIYRTPTDGKIEDFRRKFTHSMKAAKTIFGPRAFRLRRELSKGALGEWTTRINASVFQVLSVSFLDYKLEQLTRRSDSIYEAYINLISDPETKLWVDYTKTSTGDYSRIEHVFTIWNHILKDAIGECEGNDPKRCFSRALKEKLFNEQGKVCAICNQQISMIEDAEIDHIKHYWKGGKTIPENARLVHRHCNRTRSNDK
jgi:5-methylcytosine-specific restriction endonuclease McrA